MNTWDCKKGKQSPRRAAAISSFLPFTACTAEACGRAASRNKGTSTPCNRETPTPPKRRTEQQPWSWKKPFTIWNKKTFCLKIPPASIVEVKRQRWVAGKRARWGNETIRCDRRNTISERLLQHGLSIHMPYCKGGCSRRTAAYRQTQNTCSYNLSLHSNSAVDVQPYLPSRALIPGYATSQ